MIDTTVYDHRPLLHPLSFHHLSSASTHNQDVCSAHLKKTRCSELLQHSATPFVKPDSKSDQGLYSISIKQTHQQIHQQNHELFFVVNSSWGNAHLQNWGKGFKIERERNRWNQNSQPGQGSLSDRWSLWRDSIRADCALELQRSYCDRSRQHSSPSHSHLHTWITLAPFQNPVSILMCTINTKPVLKVLF